MAGLSVAPAGFKLRPGEGAELIRREATLLGGVGMDVVPSTDLDGGVILNAPAGDKDAPAGLFVPDVSTWPSTTLRLPAAESYLTLAEALIAGTTPGGATSTDCYALRVAGTTSGQQDVRMTGTGREHYWDGLEAQEFAAQSNTGAVFDDQKLFKGTRFQVSSDNILRSVAVSAGGGAGWNAGQARRYVVGDFATGEVLATSDWWDTAQSMYDKPVRQLGAAVELAQGTDYVLAVEFEAVTGNNRIMASTSSSGSFSGSAVSSAKRNVAGNTMAELVADESNIGDYPVTFWLYGSPGGVLIVGNIVLSIATFGTPPAVPTDLNVRLQWATAV